MAVTVGFFDDMYIPLHYLPQPSALYVASCLFRLPGHEHSLTNSTLLISDPNERAHFWLAESEATTVHELLESATTDRMYIDQNEVVRVRVETDELYDDEPGPPKAAEGVVVRRELRRPPYTITVSVWSPQLAGLVSHF